MPRSTRSSTSRSARSAVCFGVCSRWRRRPTSTACAPATSGSCCKTGREFRGLGRRDGFRLLRWMPMAAADLVAEWFETDLLQAAIAARGILRRVRGPWSAGTAAVLLIARLSIRCRAATRSSSRGGPGALASALAARPKPRARGSAPARGVSRVIVRDGAATGVLLEGRRGDSAPPRSSRTPIREPLSSRSWTRSISNRGSPHASGTTGARARSRRSTSRSRACRRSPASTAQPAVNRFAGRIHIGPGIDYLERAFDAAKYGTFADEPYLDVTIPSCLGSDAGAAGRITSCRCTCSLRRTGCAAPTGTAGATRWATRS